MENKLKIQASLENLHQVINFLNNSMDLINANQKVRIFMSLSCEEIFINIVKYAYEDAGDVLIVSEYSDKTRDLKVTFSDYGIPFNPLVSKYPDIKSPVQKRTEGGIGIMLARKCMDDMKYTYNNNKNITTLIKKLN